MTFDMYIIYNELFCLILFICIYSRCFSRLAHQCKIQKNVLKINKTNQIVLLVIKNILY